MYPSGLLEHDRQIIEAIVIKHRFFILMIFMILNLFMRLFANMIFYKKEVGSLFCIAKVYYLVFSFF